MHELNEEVKRISNPNGYVDSLYGRTNIINEEYYGTIVEDNTVVEEE